MNELVKPMVQIRNQSLVVYNQFVGSKKKSILQKTGTALKNVKKYTGNVTPGARKRIAKAINLLIASSTIQRIYNPVTNKNFNFRLSFITLTIPDNTKLTPKETHKILLEPFIKWMRQNHGLRNYVWKLEVQKRGQIHYHITSDCFIHYQELRNKWNSLLNRASLMEDYKLRFGKIDPNSTDIHSVKNINDLSAYLIKYFTKQEQNSKDLPGKIWDCSLALKKANYYSTDLTEDIEYDVFKNQRDKVCEIDYCDRFSIIKFKKVEPISIFPKEVKEAYYANLKSIRDYKREVRQMDMYSKKTDSCIVDSTHAKEVPKLVEVVQLDLFQSVEKNKLPDTYEKLEKTKEVYQTKNIGK